MIVAAPQAGIVYGEGRNGKDGLEARADIAIADLPDVLPDILFLPGVIISVPYYIPDRQDRKEYREIIKQTYDNAANAGDRNVYYIDGETIYGSKDIDACTVDCAHPTLSA